MSTHESDPIHHPEVQQANVTSYVSGFVSTILLLLGCLLLTVNHVMPPLPLLGIVSSLAVMLLILQAFLFFGLDLSRHNIWKSVSLVLTVPLFILSIGLTVWMFHALDAVTMSPEMPGMSMQPTTLQ